MHFSVTSSRRPATPPPIFPSRKCVAKTSLPGTDHRIVKDRTGPDLDERSVYISISPNQAIVRTTQSVSPRSPRPNRWPFARGRGPSMPGAPDVPAGCPSDAMPIRSLLSLISRNSPKRSGMVSLRQVSFGKVRWTICNLIPFAKRRLSGHESGSSVLPTAERHEEP